MTEDPRKPMSHEEVHELLTACLHGPLPQTTIYRMMATLAAWSPIVKAATTWWEGKRPLDFDEKKHLEHGSINTVSAGEAKLAMEVTEYRRLGNR
jgi:hypothetical protein